MKSLKAFMITASFIETTTCLSSGEASCEESQKCQTISQSTEKSISSDFVLSPSFLCCVVI